MDLRRNGAILWQLQCLINKLYKNIRLITLKRKGGVFVIRKEKLMKITKKLFTFVLTAGVFLSLVGCSAKPAQNDTLKDNTNSEIILNEVDKKYEILEIEEIKNNAYEKDMSVTVDENDNVLHMVGNFGLVVEDKNEAYTLLQQYKQTLGFSENTEFLFLNEREQQTTKAYVFSVGYKNIPVADHEVIIGVEKDTKNVSFINANFEKDDISVDLTANKDIEKLIKETYGENSLFEPGNEFITKNPDEEKDDYIYCKEYFVLEDKNGNLGNLYEICIDLTSGKIISEQQPLYYLNDGEAVEEKETLFESEISYVFNIIEEDGIKYAVVNDTMKDYKAPVIEENGYYVISDDAIHIQSYGEVLDTAELLKTYVGYEKINEAVKIPVSEAGKENEEFFHSVVSYNNMKEVFSLYSKVYGVTPKDIGGNDKIIVNTNVAHKLEENFETDNAFFQSNDKNYYILPSGSEVFPYYQVDVLAHEMGHSIVNANKASSFAGSKEMEYRAINEGYADILSMTITQDEDWCIADNYNSETGEKIYVRDLKEIPEDLPDQYKSDEWVSYFKNTNFTHNHEHRAGRLLSNIAYQMYSKLGMTHDEIGQIWYRSLTYGYKNSDTFVTVRQYVIQAMRDLNYEVVNGKLYYFDEDLISEVEKIFESYNILKDYQEYYTRETATFDKEIFLNVLGTRIDFPCTYQDFANTGLMWCKLDTSNLLNLKLVENTDYFSIPPLESRSVILQKANSTYNIWDSYMYSIVAKNNGSEMLDIRNAPINRFNMDGVFYHSSSAESRNYAFVNDFIGFGTPIENVVASFGRPQSHTSYNIAKIIEYNSMTYENEKYSLHIRYDKNSLIENIELRIK